MAQLTAPSQTWSGTQDFGPVAKPAGASLASIQPATPTDWQTGTPGRTVTATIQVSIDGRDPGQPLFIGADGIKSSISSTPKPEQ
jgi:hypothetical protein